MSELSAADIIRMLDLKPHPEGGHFRETFRDENTIATDDGGARAASTAIYFLLGQGEVSHWHRVDAVEIWHWHAGAPLQLSIAPPDGTITDLIVGSDLVEGERPQGIVPPGYWQSARSLGAWTLVSCTVAPGFLFEKFELGPPDFSPPRT
ncbi:cupin domain-containing protein [Hyphomicrobium sulfonivorans]|uniref:cupin domain-containing protein n=1 Tax=Hyphomicrobium sulfonivorans TaxID=121290 RepID=UPI00156EAAE7|nr:cupin domain-containing protein [Hyphomicrobium sulfonivorans]MBI1648854.1 cupin domain-containing protein [Hyphomicrobium sulfonivorans]NSL70611.1 cupin [Hyphomicrobium sulfonivorans]